jgi:alkanesulfonate monooxygenase SsuD/methylene tetrahydromethanopterin reductase-like flavin-dependent oxidoreductase (luciferase family)
MDRFNPAVYPLAYEYADGILSFRTGPEETLSHYAEWAGVSEAVLRKANRLRRARDFRLGRRFRIPLTEEHAREFMRRREENYRAVEEDFYGNYYVSATEPMAVRKGMNLWTWAQEQEIPFWLMQKHNPGKSLSDLHPGDTLNLPLIETGVRKWGFTRYANTREYLDGIARYLAKPKAGP